MNDLGVPILSAPGVAIKITETLAGLIQIC
jgi:hypothetical protein